MAHSLLPVPFHGNTIHAVVLDGRPYVSVRSICDALSVDYDGQIQRIRRHPVLAQGVCVTQTPSAGGPQQTVLLPLDLLNGWLFGITAARLRDATKRERLVQYQRECFSVLAAHFGAGPAVRPQPAAYEQLSATDYNNISRVVWLISRHFRFEQSMVQGVWHAIRQATGVPAPQRFGVHHLPAIALELRRCLAVARAYSEAQFKAEAMIVKRVVRKREAAEPILAEAAARFATANQETDAKLAAALESWDEDELVKLIQRTPALHDHSPHAETKPALRLEQQ